MLWFRIILFLLSLLSASLASGESGGSGGSGGSGSSVHGYSVFGDLKYGSNFGHFDYVEVGAVKGGELRRMALGTFDSLNPFIDRGTSVSYVLHIYDTLLHSSAEEVGVSYVSLAESVRVSGDGMSVTFVINSAGRWHDGESITARDVEWSFETLISEGSPSYRSLLRDIESIEVVSPLEVTFHLSSSMNRDLPLLLGQVPILPYHYWSERDFGAVSLEPPLGSGAYRIESVSGGRSITFERVEDYWGADLPVSRGLDNFDIIRYDYYRDQSIAFEAFKVGGYDLREENTAKYWSTGYDIPAVLSGDIVMSNFPHHRVSNFQGIFFNLRNPLFRDVRVREALNRSWNFEWVNRNIMYGAYSRLQSYFSNHALSSEGISASSEELEILGEYGSLVPSEILSGRVFEMPVSSAHRHNREQLKIAHGLLRDAGWELRDGILHHAELGLDFSFTILLYSDSFTAHLQPMVAALKRLGIEMNLRIVDTSQYSKRVLQFEYDATILAFSQTDLPGAEQKEFWGSEAADTPYSRNIGGVKNPVIDSLIEKIIKAESYEQLIILTRALDRMLLWNWYTIPLYSLNSDRIAYKNKFCMPQKPIPYTGVQINSWWQCAS